MRAMELAMPRGKFFALVRESATLKVRHEHVQPSRTAVFHPTSLVCQGQVHQLKTRTGRARMTEAPKWAYVHVPRVFAQTADLAIQRFQHLSAGRRSNKQTLDLNILLRYSLMLPSTSSVPRTLLFRITVVNSTPASSSKMARESVGIRKIKEE